MLRHGNIETLLAQMREEASDVRSCFRTLATQAMGFAAGAVLGMLAGLEKVPDIAWAALIVMMVIIAVQRVGIHKFTTANRILGYELHLERLDKVDYNRLANVLGWEEALRAWRIVQATVFQQIYMTPQNWFTELPIVADYWPPLYRPRTRPNYKAPATATKELSDIVKSVLAAIRAGDWQQGMSKGLSVIKKASSSDWPRVIRNWIWTPVIIEFILTKKCPRTKSPDIAECWWLQSERVGMVSSDCKYHAGSYLERVFAILEILEFACIVPLALHCYMFWEAPERKPLVSLALLSIGALLWLFNRTSIARRREILEDEFLSIHSCAIMWKAVVLAHKCAWGKDVDQRRTYTERLARVASWFAVLPELIRCLIDLPELPDELAQSASSDDTLKGDGQRSAALKRLVDIVRKMPSQTKFGASIQLVRQLQEPNAAFA
ncbi:MAG: hypothetical protein HOP29_02705 [Phycisphaerales bacterium]|nr:hypothetical protein [Phycisphaerales bacterium]